MRRPFLLLLCLVACSGSSEPPVGGSPVDCDGLPVASLAPGEASLTTVNSTGGCIRLASQSADAEYLILAYSANGEERPGGASGEFSIYVGSDTFSAPATIRAGPALTTDSQGRLHDRLRQRERKLAWSPTAGAIRTSRVAGPVVVGDQRTFQVCADLECGSYAAVAATAHYAGSHGAVFLDDDVPAGGYTEAEIDSVGALFEQYIYPIDTTAFGRESDVDGNGQVFILLTDQVNHLSGSCPAGDIVVGYFSGQDLRVQQNSNGAEIFFGLVPDPASSTCPIDHATARRRLPPVLIHEFQHMISYHRHVLLTQGGAAEETWLNEGLSQFAEELGARQIATGWCTGGNCVNQFAKSNITNAYNFLLAPELYYLVEPQESLGSLQERGANWLFVRWLAEQAPGDSARGTAVTRRLLGADASGGTGLRGMANVAGMAGSVIEAGLTFPRLLAEWHGANYVEGRGDLPALGRLRYRSWNLGSAFDQLVLGPYPLRPDSIGGAYHGTGNLRGGTGRLVRLTRPAGSTPLAVGVLANGPTEAHLFLVRLK